MSWGWREEIEKLENMVMPLVILLVTKFQIIEGVVLKNLLDLDLMLCSNTNFLMNFAKYSEEDWVRIFFCIVYFIRK